MQQNSNGFLNSTLQVKVRYFQQGTFLHNKQPQFTLHKMKERQKKKKKLFTLSWQGFELKSSLTHPNSQTLSLPIQLPSLAKPAVAYHFNYFHQFMAVALSIYLYHQITGNPNPLTLFPDLFFSNKSNTLLLDVQGIQMKSETCSTQSELN